MDKKSLDLKKLFNPSSIVVIGASRHPEKIGHKILKNILESGFQGKVFPVNPEAGEILNRKVYPSVKEIKTDIDMAVIAVPAKLVYEVASECASKKVKFLIIISAGFAETGNKEEEEKIAVLAEKSGMRVLGPNVFGLWSASASLNATFSSSKIKSGNLAIVSQSGALGIALIGKTKEEGLGLSNIVSVGNSCDLKVADIIDYLADDKQTKVILLYLEGVKSGRRLIESGRKASTKKPIIVIKAGRFEKGKKAALSHTGALAVEEAVFSGIGRQLGIIQVETINQALNCAKFLTQVNLKKELKNALIITNGGGFGVLASDAAEKYKLPLYENEPELKKTFKPFLPDFGSPKNPVDLSGQANKQTYQKVLDIALAHKEIDSLICLGCETAILPACDFFELVTDYQNSSKPIIFSFLGSETKCSSLKVMPEAEAAVFVLANFYHYQQNQIIAHKRDQPTTSTKINNNKAVAQLLATVSKSGRMVFSPEENKKLLNFLDIPIPKSIIASNLKATILAAKSIGYPVVLKIVAEGIYHKNEAGGVKLNLGNEGELKDAYEQIISNCQCRMPQAKIYGVEVTQMIENDIQLIIGARQDPVFGPIIMAGSGGIYVELMKDIAFCSWPAGLSQIEKMLQQTKIYPLIKNAKSLTEIIYKVGALIKNFPEIRDLEINPLVFTRESDKLIALDAKINICS